MVSINEAQRYIKDKKSLYDFLRRSSYVLPPLKDAFCKKDTLKGILLKTHWCLTESTVQRYRVCPDPPSRKQLAEILHGVLYGCAIDEPEKTTVRNTADEILKRPPCIEWQLIILGTVDGGNDVFRKDYHKPVRESEAFSATVNVDIDPELFQGMPACDRHVGRKMSLLSAEQVAQVKLQRMEMTMARMQERLDNQRRASAALSQPQPQP